MFNKRGLTHLKFLLGAGSGIAGIVAAVSIAIRLDVGGFCGGTVRLDTIAAATAVATRCGHLVSSSLTHILDVVGTLLRVGVGGEQLGKFALLSTLTAKADEYVQGMVHGVGIHAILDAELEGGLVSLGLLTARISILCELLTDVTEETRREGTSRGVDGSDTVTGGYHEIGCTLGIANILINKVTQLVSDDGKHLIVVHGVHKACVDAHATVATGKGVDGAGLIDLVVEVQV